MIIVSNEHIPFKPYTAMTVWPFVFVREEVLVSYRLLRHEGIHGMQQLEMGVVAIIAAILMTIAGCGWWSLLVLPLYYYVYGLMYLVCRVWSLITHRSQTDAYRRNPMECEAYANEQDVKYKTHRRPFAWVPYIWKE